MADLDDFFAKKDKKKSKATKPKFLTTEELVKNLEETSKREVIVKPPATEITATTETADAGTEVVEQQAPLPQPVAADDEWKEFEEEARKDYTGLKIGQLQINDDEEDLSQDDDDEEGENNNTNNAEHSGRHSEVSGPWKKVVPAEEVTQIPMVESNEKRGVYISPALRAAQQGSGAGSGIRRNRAAPDITNADFFPTLGAARPEEQRKKKNEPAFEEVKHGSRVQRIQPQVAAPVSVANRFQTLDEDDS